MGYATTFTPPTAVENNANGGALLERYTLERGVTLTQTGGVFTQIRFPVQDELDASDSYWRGGYIYFVLDPVADRLSAAGYGAGLVDVETDGSATTPIAYPDDLLYPGFYPAGDPFDAFPAAYRYPGFYPGD